MNFKLARFQVFAVVLALGIVPVVPIFPAAAAGTQDEAGILAVILLNKINCQALTGSIGSTTVNLERDSLFSSYDVSGKIGSSRVEVDFNALFSSYDVSGKIGSSRVEVDFNALFSSYDVSGNIGSSRVEVDFNALFSTDDASGSFGGWTVKLNCVGNPAVQGSESTGSQDTSVATSVCVKEKGQKEVCQEGATWSYENCWQFSKKGLVMFQVKRGSNWKTLNKNVATRDLASCYKKHPWLVSVERTESSEGNKVYRLKFPDGDTKQIQVRRLN